MRRIMPPAVMMDEMEFAERFLEGRSVRELVSIYRPVMGQLANTFSRDELINAILGYYTPDEVVRQYAYALIGGGGISDF